MRVWHFLSGDLWAGAEVMACTLLKGLRSHSEISPAVLLLNEGRLAEELRGSGLPVVVLEERRRPFLALVREARRILCADPPDLIHAHRYKENILAFLASRPGRPVPLVATQHGLPETRGTGMAGRLTARANTLLLARSYSQVVAVSSNIRQDYFRQRGIPAARSRVIHNGIELPQPEPPPLHSRPVLGSVGRLTPVKDYPLLVAVAREMKCADALVDFRLAGSGPERATIEGMVAASKLDTVFTLAGEVADISGFYRQLDIYLCTSQHEGLPLSMLEAMAHGLPVVAPDVGGLRDLVSHGTDGFLLDSRDPRAFAEVCLRLVRDTQLRQRMGLAARAKVAGRFSAALMTASYARLYREMSGAPCPAKGEVDNA